MLQEIISFIHTRKKVNLLIVLINVIVFILTEILRGSGNLPLLYEYGAMYIPAVIEKGEYYRLFTCMFLHFGAEHLLYNMLLLIFMGDMLETQVGKIRYLIIYLGGGLIGNLFSMAVAMEKAGMGLGNMAAWSDQALDTGIRFGISAGASGAIFAVVGALVIIVIRNGGTLGDVGIKRLGLMAVLSLAQGFTESGVDNMAHLGGFLGGVVLCLMLNLAGRVFGIRHS